MPTTVPRWFSYRHRSARPGCAPATTTNPNHCGACGVVCAVGRSCVAGACTALGGAVPINFDNLSAGTVITTQYSGVVFSSVAGRENVAHSFVCGGSSPPNILCTRVTNGSLNCTQPTFLAFATPVSGLHFRGVGIDNSVGSIVARANVYAGSTLLGSRNVIAAGSSVGVVIDCSAFSGVTRLEIVNIVDGGGIGWDNFTYTQEPPRPRLQPLPPLIHARTPTARESPRGSTLPSASLSPTARPSSKGCRSLVGRWGSRVGAHPRLSNAGAPAAGAFEQERRFVSHDARR